jgi:aryl-alcohol dehydrogenase-like predicted oxidoreductase
MTTIEQFEIKPGYSVSRILKGGWHLAGGHGDIDRKQAVEDMAAFVEAGVTTFDCADIYTGVEELIGDFRAAYPELATKIRVHTKFVPDHDQLANVDFNYVETIINRSLERLRMEQLDLVQYCWWDLSIPGYVDAGMCLAKLKEQGKINELAVTNYGVANMQELSDAGYPIFTNQLQYSLIDARAENGTIEFSQKNNIHLLCFGSLAGGFLSDSWLGTPEPTEAFTNRSLTKYKLIIDDFGGWDLFQELLRILRTVADRHNATIGQVAVRWVQSRPMVAAAIVGATSTRHLDENVRIFDLTLTDQDFADIEAVRSKRQGPEGDCYDLERDKTGRHGRIMKYNLNDDRD